MALTIVASIRAESGKETFLEAELQKLVELTRKEAGCIQYDLHRNNEEPGHFLFFENWDSRDLWQAHMESDHIAAYKTATEGAVAEFLLHEMDRIA